MTPRIYLVGFLMMTSFTVFCQEHKVSYFSFGMGPFGLLDPITPSLNLIVEKNLGKKFSLEMTYGLDLIETSWARWHPNPEFRHHEYKLGFKYIPYLSELDNNIIWFIGLEFFGVSNHYEKEQGQYHENGVRFLYDSADVSRSVRGGRTKMGTKIFYNRMEIELYAGVGVRRLLIDYNAVNLRPAEQFWDEEGWIAPIDENATNRTKLDLNFGFKVAYPFRKTQ